MADLGWYLLRLALLVAGVGIAAGVYAGVTRRAAWTQVAERAVVALFALCSVAIGALFYAFATLDFQLAYVAQNSARSMDLHYRIAALWGGQAGSLLLWLWMLAAYSAAAVVALRREARGLLPWASAVLLANAAFFLVLLNFISNPFEKLPPGQVLSDGSGLNPLLQHPVMMIHPVMLYTGLTGLAVPFAFGLAAASFFPVLLLGIFDARTNKQGAIAGMLSGIGFTAAYIVWFRFVRPEAGADAWLFGVSPEGIGALGMALNLAVTFTVSRLTPPPPEKVRRLVEEIRHPGGSRDLPDGS